MNGSKTWIVVGVVVIVIIAALGVVLFTGGGEDNVTISQKGSDTMLQLMQGCAEAFHEEEPTISVQITGGGSGVGISALINGQIDIAQASRPMKDSEIENAQANGVDPVEFRVAIDGIAVVVNEGNPVGQLTMEQLRGVYNGTYINWNELGGPDMIITAYGRQSTSGTYAFFQEEVLLSEDYRLDMQQMTGNAAIIDGVREDDTGIGYVGIGYAEGATGITIVTLAQEEGGEAYSPLDSDAVYSGAYPLARFLYLYTAGTPTGAVHTWIAWILSDSGQAVVAAEGFYPLDDATLSAELEKLG